MPDTPKVIEIFDRKKVRRNRDRCAAHFENHDFLLEWVNRNLNERLQDIKHEFPMTLQIGGRGFKKEKIIDKAGIDKRIVMDVAEKHLHPDALSIQADEEFLPFVQNSFDMVISPLSLHTVNDLPGALIQINRALKPDGLFLGAILGGETLYELRHCLMQAEIEIRGGTGPHIAPFADKQQIGSLMQRARFALPVVDSEIVTVTYESVSSLMHDLRGMGENNNLKERSSNLNKSVLNKAEEIYRTHFADDDERLRSTFEIIFMIGWAPHETQQKPLRPGSAKNRLADALETAEIKT